MGRRLPRFTVRQLLAAVAIAAVVFAMVSEALRLVGKGQAYREEALRQTRIITQLDRTYHALSKMKRIAKRDGFVDPLANLGLAGRIPSKVFRIHQEEDARMTELVIRMQWHERMRDKYKRAAERPWLPVEPDPPGMR